MDTLYQSLFCFFYNLFGGLRRLNLIVIIFAFDFFCEVSTTLLDLEILFCFCIWMRLHINIAWLFLKCWFGEYTFTLWSCCLLLGWVFWLLYLLRFLSCLCVARKSRFWVWSLHFWRTLLLDRSLWLLIYFLSRHIEAWLVDILTRIYNSMLFSHNFRFTFWLLITVRNILTL